MLRNEGNIKKTVNDFSCFDNTETKLKMNSLIGVGITSKESSLHPKQCNHQ